MFSKLVFTVWSSLVSREKCSEEAEERVLPDHPAPDGKPRDVEEGDRRGDPETGPGSGG